MHYFSINQGKAGIGTLERRVMSRILCWLVGAAAVCWGWSTCSGQASDALSGQAGIQYSFNLPLSMPSLEDMSIRFLPCGDCDRDGKDDLLLKVDRPVKVPTWSERLLSGRVFVVRGGVGTLLWQWPSPAEPVTTSILSAAILGDLDKDSVPDVCLGIVEVGESARESEAAYVCIISGATGQLIRKQHSTVPTRLVGDWSGHVLSYGACVGGCGDVNGDHMSDYFVGAPEQVAERQLLEKDIGKTASACTAGNGYVEAYSGATGELLWRQAKITCEHGFGVFAAAIGDVNDDGAIDIAVGAPPSPVAHLHNEDWYGEIDVLSGATGRLLHYWRGQGKEAAIGSSVCRLGDIDGDGSVEVIADMRTQWGQLEGLAIGRLSRDSCDSPLVSAGEEWKWLQWEVLGDVNGDGKCDVSVSDIMRQQDKKGWSARARIISGQTGEQFWEKRTLDVPAERRIAVGPAGDIDGDGRQECCVCDQSTRGDDGALVIDVVSISAK